MEQKTNKLKNLLKIGILLLGITLFITSCQKDDNPIKQEQGIHKPSPKTNISYNDFLDKFGNNKSSKSNQNSKPFPLENYTFGKPSNIASKENEQSIIHYIDTTNIVAFEFDYVQTYTFNVVPTIDSENTFYNIIFYQNSEGTQNKLLKYVCDIDYLASENIPFSGIIYEIEEDETVVNTYSQANQTSNMYSKSTTVEDCAFSTSIVNYDCTGNNHEVGQDGCLCGTPNHDCTPAISFEVTDLVCETVVVGGGDSGDDSIGGTGTTADDNPNQNDDGTYNLPTDPVKGEIDLEEIGRLRECKKISDLLDNSPTYLQKIQNIATKVNEDKEYSLSIHEDDSENEEIGTVGSGGIEYTEYSSAYKFHIHTHDNHGENGQGTLSIYSIDDLIMYAKLAYYNKLDSGTFVAFLATNDGTNYALTINDQNKLIDLFYDRLDIPLTIDNVAKLGTNTQKVEDLFDKYYNPKNSNRKLKVDSQNPGNDLVHFMNLLDEGDMGVSIFESTDNFQTFENITLKNNNNTDIEKTPCN